MVTRADVAKRAGVSPSTVTYALTGERSIAEPTRLRVLKAAEELGYRPNAQAQSLAGGRTRALALVFPSSERGLTDSDVEYLIGAARAARKRDYRVLLWTLDGEELADLADLAQGGLVDGVLLMEVRLADERVEFLRRIGMPFALIGRTAETDGLIYSDRDFVEVARMAVEYLAGLGHRRVALISSPHREHELGLGAVVRVHDAFERAATDLGVQLDVHECAPTVEDGRAVFLQLMAADPPVTAAIGTNDEATLGIYQGAQIHGFHIPDDLSVISAMLSPARATFFYPPITTISPPALQIGRSAASALIDQLTGRTPRAAQTLWPGQLVERASSAPPRRRR